MNSIIRINNIKENPKRARFQLCSISLQRNFNFNFDLIQVILYHLIHTMWSKPSIYHRGIVQYLSRHTAAYNQYQILNMSYPFPTYFPSRYGKYSFAMFKNNIGRAVKTGFTLQVPHRFVFQNEFEMKNYLVEWKLLWLSYSILKS